MKQANQLTQKLQLEIQKSQLMLNLAVQKLRECMDLLLQLTDPATAQPLEIDSLAEREREVFDLIGQGKGVKEIALAMNISYKTVESHRDHIKQKLNFKSAHELKTAAQSLVRASR